MSSADYRHLEAAAHILPIDEAQARAEGFRCMVCRRAVLTTFARTVTTARGPRILCRACEPGSDRRGREA